MIIGIRVYPIFIQFSASFKLDFSARLTQLAAADLTRHVWKRKEKKKKRRNWQFAKNEMRKIFTLVYDVLVVIVRVYI